MPKVRDNDKHYWQIKKVVDNVKSYGQMQGTIPMLQHWNILIYSNKLKEKNMLAVYTCKQITTDSFTLSKYSEQKWLDSLCNGLLLEGVLNRY